MLASLREHKEHRDAARSRKEEEQRRIQANWDLETRRLHEARLHEFFDRLSKRNEKEQEKSPRKAQNKGSASPVHMRQLSESVSSKTLRLSPMMAKHDEVKERLMLALKLQENKETELRAKVDERLFRASLALSRVKGYQKQSIERSKDELTKKVLRSKLHVVLSKELGSMCARYYKFEERMQEKESPKPKSKLPGKKALHWLESYIHPQHAEPLPDDVILSNFDSEQLKRVLISGFYSK